MARGSIYRRSGGWAYRAELDPDPVTGRRRQQSKQGFKTKREAENALAELQSEVKSGSVVARNSTDVGSYLDDWVEGQRSRLKATTWESYRVAVERVKSRIGKVRLQSLTAPNVEDLYRELAKNGGRGGKPLASKTVRNTHIVLRKAFADAERLDLLARNPASVAKPPVVQQSEQQVWNSDELRAFLNHVSADRLQAIWVLLATTGMRRGEAVGLRWQDVDLGAGDLRIMQTITTVRDKPVISTPKSKRSRRAIYLDDQTVTVLRDHRRRQQEERDNGGDLWNPDNELVFTDEVGNPLHPDRLTREFERQVRLAKLRPIRLHGLRHTYATVALKAGVHPKIVSERLGHASVAVTLDLYSHVTPSIGRDAATEVAQTIFGPPADGQ